MNKCLNCDTDTSNPKYCSRSCSAAQSNRLYPRRVTKRKCLVCGTKVPTYRDARCKIHKDAYAKKRKDSFKLKTIGEYQSHLSVKGKHSSWKNAHIRILNRNWNKDMTLLPCAKCGYDKHVELCHKKAVSSFPKNTPLGVINAKENIVQLCRNCHWEFDHGLLKM